MKIGKCSGAIHRTNDCSGAIHRTNERSGASCCENSRKLILPHIPTEDSRESSSGIHRTNATATKCLINQTATILLILGLLMGGIAAGEKKEKGEEVVTKAIVGEVACFTPRGDPKFIGIAVDKENTDYYFIIDENLKIVNKESLKEIEIGDKVEVEYRVERIPPKDKDTVEKTKRVTTSIRFIKSGKSVEGIYNSKE